MSIIINWPVHSGCMTDVCVPRRDHSTAEPLVCHRGSVTDLCQVLVQAPTDFQVIQHKSRSLILIVLVCTECTSMAKLLQGLCTMSCSARTCEVYEQQDKDSTSYVATTRGKPAGELFQHSINLPAAAKTILRMLSLKHPGILHIHHIQLEANSDIDLQQGRSADKGDSLQHRQGWANKSQQAEVQAMLQQMMSSG